MTAPTHITFAAASTLALVHFTEAQAPSAIAWVAIIFGSLAPDIDSDRSTISRPGTIFVRLLPRFCIDLMNAFGGAISWFIQKTFGHRGVLHWPLVGVLLMLLGMGSGMEWFAWFCWAYLSHIIADACTVRGLPLLAPVLTKNISWSPVRTGSFTEVILCLGMLVGIAMLGFQYLPEQTQFWLQYYAGFVI